MLNIKPKNMNNIKHINPVRLFTLLGVGCTLLFLLSGCTQAVECGNWVFSSTPSGSHLSVNNSAFTFSPSTCGSGCQCQQDAIIQMVWVYDVDNRMNILTAGGETYDSHKSTSYGWKIDRLDVAINPYYALQNNGTFNTALWGNGGTAGTPTNIMDGPGGFACNILFAALDVAICRQDASCPNKILGSQFWIFSIDNYVASQGSSSLGWTGIEQRFLEADSVWNVNWVPFSQTITLNDGTVGPPYPTSAVTIPALTDL
jgi:hypothetical protein